MGTRHATIVIKDNEPVIAQYGQWDGYPGGVGVDILAFLSGENNLQKLQNNLEHCVFLEDADVTRLWETVVKLNGDFVGVDESERMKNVWPSMHRDTGGDILEVVAGYTNDGELFEVTGKHRLGIPLTNSYNFVSDSLFCEWAYVIDLDAGTFEVYRGFNDHTPLTEEDRFYSMNNEKNNYHPCRLHAKWELDALPDEENFLKICEQDRLSS